MFYRFLCSITDRFSKLMSDNQKYISRKNTSPIVHQKFVLETTARAGRQQQHDHQHQKKL